MFTRRSMLQSTTAGFGYLALARISSMAAEKEHPLALKQPHFPERAKRGIFLCMEGAPSHMDTFDYKPNLNKVDGQPLPNPRAPRSAKVMTSPWSFKQYSECGHWISELFPEAATCADDLCVLRNMQTDVPAHPQAFAQLHTGSFQFRFNNKCGWIHEIDDADQRYNTMAKSYANGWESGETVLAIAPTHAEAALLTGTDSRRIEIARTRFQGTA